MNTVFITKSGKEELEKKIINQKIIIDEILREKAIAYEVSGDGWHDNPGFNQLGLKEEQAIKELKAMENRLSAVQVLDITERNTEKVSIGSIVQIAMVNIISGEVNEMLLEIVGSGESNYKLSKISYDSPIGTALLGMVPGEIKDVVIPKGKTKIRVLQLLKERPDSIRSSAE